MGRSGIPGPQQRLPCVWIYPFRSIVAVSVFTATQDGQPMECHLRSIRFKAADGTSLNLDLNRIAPKP